MAMKAKKAEEQRIEVMEISIARSNFCLLGRSPLIMHRMPEKAWHELLLPAPKKNAAERIMTLKHDPIAEFRSSVYRNRDADAPTRFHMPNGAFKKALASAAIDIPGATKSQIGRLTDIEGEVFIYGLPLVHCAIVRQSGMTRTPDVRTRAAFRTWACRIKISYVANLIIERQVANLLNAAGTIIGIGDNRPEKGADSFGKWEVVDESDARFQSLLKSAGAKEQTKALDNPVAFDEETEELLAWFDSEIIRREKNLPSAASAREAQKRRTNGKPDVTLAAVVAARTSTSSKHAR